jgi:hypothetical protein
VVVTDVAPFEEPENHAVLTFDDTSPYHGAVVTMSLDLSIDDALLFDKLHRDGDVDALFDELGNLLVSWNLTKHGEAIPATPAYFRARPQPFLMQLLGAYFRALKSLVTVDEDFEGGSSGGDTSA